MDPFQQQFGHNPSDPYIVRQDLLQSPNTLATVVHAIVRDKYGDEAYWWDPLTVALELKADFQVAACPEVMDRWSAMQVVMTGDSFFKRIDSFFAVCNAFSSGDPFFGAFDPVTAEEAAWAIAEVGMNRDMLPFSPTIRKYCEIILEQNGYGRESHPPIFDVVFDGTPTLKDIREGLVSKENGVALRTYLMENVDSLAGQFDSLGDMKGVDRDILKKGLSAALAERAQKADLAEKGL